MTRTVGSIAALASIAMLLAFAPAASAKGCSVGDERSYGTTYVLKISVNNTTCRAGKDLVKAFHACRSGKSGRCDRVRRYSCSESRFNKGATSYDSRVTCKRGGKTVKHTYTQFT